MLTFLEKHIPNVNESIKQSVTYLDENRIERFANIKDIKEYCNRIDEMIQGKINLLDSLYLKGEE